MTTSVALVAVLAACSDLTTPIREFFAPARPNMSIAPGLAVVWPGNMHGWSFVQGPDSTIACDGACGLVEGPGTPPLGTGSAQLVTTLTYSGLSTVVVGATLVLAEYKNVRFDQMTDLRYGNYRLPLDEGTVNPTTLEFVVDYDLNDQLTAAQGRIVYDPSKTGGFTVSQGTWQTWDAKAGKWWGTQSSVQRGGQTITNPCVSATPCTWSELLTAFPNIGVHATLGAVMLNAPPPGAFGSRSNVDKLEIGISGAIATFDFELNNPDPVPATAPDSVPAALWDSIIAPSNILTNAPGISGRIVRDLVYVKFFPSATQSDRQAAIDAVNGRVVGGMRLGGPEHYYAVRLPYVLAPGDSTSGIVLRAEALLLQNPKVQTAILGLMDPLGPYYRRPKDGSNYSHWALNADSATMADGNWGMVAIEAPLAWGCSTGQAQVHPRVAIVDYGFFDEPELRPNLGAVREFLAATDTTTPHGTRVAGLVGAVGNNDSLMTGMLWDRGPPVPIRRMPGLPLTPVTSAR